MTPLQTNGHGNSMTDPAQRAESVKIAIQVCHTALQWSAQSILARAHFQGSDKAITSNNITVWIISIHLEAWVSLEIGLPGKNILQSRFILGNPTLALVRHSLYKLLVTPPTVRPLTIIINMAVMHIDNACLASILVPSLSRESNKDPGSAANYSISIRGGQNIQEAVYLGGSDRLVDGLYFIRDDGIPSSSAWHMTCIMSCNISQHMTIDLTRNMA